MIETALRQAIAETPPMNADTWFRISSFGGICPREEVLRHRFGVAKTAGIDPNLGLTFEFGHDIHYMMQNKVMPATGKIIGSWRCTWCGETYGSLAEGMVPRPEQCLRCGGFAGEAYRKNGKPIVSGRSESFVFVEEWVGNSEYMIGGSPDGYYVDGDPAKFTNDDIVLLEFKSASENNFSKYVKAADFMHVIQCQCYMWLTGFKRAKILYINKGIFGLDGLVEHDIRYDQDTVTLVQKALKDVRVGLNGGPVPPRELCDSPSCPRANGCAVSRQCFSGGV